MSAPLADAERELLLERAGRLEPLVRERLAAVRQRIAAAGGDPGAVEVVAVTKGFGPEAAVAALGAGLTEIGENYAASLLEKAPVLEALGLEAHWHFLGRIQRNKVGRLAPVVSCFETVSREAEARAIAARAPRPPTAFIEVNVAGDPERPGCRPEEVPALAEAVRATGLALRGLMAVAPNPSSPATAEAAFSAVARLADELGLRERSMGMTGDLEAAVRAGTTMVRVGTALFGPRDPHTAR